MFRQGCILATLIAAVVAIGAGGCAENEVTLETGPTLAPADLGIAKGSPPTSGYVLLDAQTSQGRFPAALAIARLGPAQNLGVESGWQVISLKTEQAMYWNSLLRTMPDIREVIVLDHQAMADANASIPEIAAAAKRRQAGLCFVYGPAAAADDHVAYLGVMVDTNSSRHLAIIRAEAGPADYQPPREDRLREDLRDSDAQFLAARKLETQVKRCVLELIGRDQRQPAADPNPWREASSRPAPEVIVVPAVPRRLY